MEKDIGKLIVRFNNKAVRLYSNVFGQLHSSVRRIERINEENVFQMQVSKFSHELRRQLEQQVQKLLDSSDSTIHKQLQAVLSKSVNYYVQQFLQKCNSL